ncbi:unnamed protein product [Closterium sp. NIES-64]|nr:unnamed protein product [Closterium sp. NIES-64]
MDYSARVRPRTSVYHSLREAGGGVATGAVESLPDELLLLILSKAASAAASPVDLANFALTSPRFARLVREPPVRSRLPLRALVPSARLWARPPAISAGDTNSANTARDSSGAYGGERNTTVTDSSGGGGGSDKCRMACRFLLQCGLAGCTDALYVLGMIKFYCHRDFWAGASLLVWAAEKGHVAAICSLAIIHSHGSGGGSSDGNPAAATDILWHAARAGSKQALQELGHCYLDGHGVPQRTLLGARLLLAAMCPALAHSPHSAPAVQSAAVRAAGPGAATTLAAATPPSHLLAHSLHSARADPAQATSFLNVRSNRASTVSLQPVLPRGSSSLSVQPLRGQQGPVISIVRCAAGCHTAISVLSHSSPSSGCTATPHALAPCSSSSTTPTAHTTTSHSSFAGSTPSRLASGPRADLASDPSSRWQVRDAPWAAGSADTNTMDGDLGWRASASAAAPAVLGAAVDLNLEAAAAAAAALAAEQHGLTSKIAELFAPSGESGGGAESGQGQAGFEDLVAADAGTSGCTGAHAAAGVGAAGAGGGASNGHSMASFFRDWNALHGLPDGCKMCENAQCGRPETRAHEFRRCVVCERAAYCSRYCQVMDWKRIHYRVCKSGGTHTH